MRSIACLVIMVLFSVPAMATDDLHLHTANIPPFTIADSPERPGFAVEIAREAARRMGLGFSVTFQPWNRAQAAVMHGKNLAILPLARSSEREERYAWVGEVFKIDVNFVSIDGHQHTLASAKESGSVLVQEGTSFKNNLISHGFGNVKAVTETAANARMLAAGRSATWYVPELEALWLWKSLQLPGTLTIGMPITSETNWLALSPDSDPELAKSLAAALKAMVADGTRDDIITSYMSNSLQ